MSTILPATSSAIDEAATRIRAGRLVAFATETVYGLGADARSDRAVLGIFETKGRPRFNPLIVHVPDLAAAGRVARVGGFARKLAEAFWPGPLTLVVPKRGGSENGGGLSDLVTAGLDTIAVRVPGRESALALLQAAGMPIAAPSANRSGRISPTTASHVAEDFADQDDLLILDDGPCKTGVESTILGFSTGPSGESRAVLLRAGAIERERLEEVIGGPLLAPSPERPDAPASPGRLASHYAPSAQVRLEVRDPRPGEALLAFGPDVPNHEGPLINLSTSGDLREAAIALFAALRWLDATGTATIAVMPIPETGLGEAINDRLRRAAAPRV